MTWQHIPLHCSGITSALKSNIPFATNWGRQRGHLWFIRVHISFICYGRYCPVLRVWGGNSSLSTASPLISIFKVSFPVFTFVAAAFLVLHFQIFNHFLSYLWSLFHNWPHFPPHWGCVPQPGIRFCHHQYFFCARSGVFSLHCSQWQTYSERNLGSFQRLPGVILARVKNWNLYLSAWIPSWALLQSQPLCKWFTWEGTYRNTCLSRGIISILSHYSWICSLLQSLGALEVLLFVSFCHLHKNPCLMAETASRVIDNNGWNPKGTAFLQ